VPIPILLLKRLAIATAAMIGLSATPRALAADKLTATQLIELAKSASPGLPGAITSTFDAKDLKEGTAWAGHGTDFFFAVQGQPRPQLLIDGSPGPQMQQLGSDLWYTPARIEQLGKLHSFYYLVNGAKFGGKLDLPAFGPLSYLQSGVRSGTLSDKITHTSKIYDGMRSDYWIYVPAQYKPDTPAALMVFQDGSFYTDRNSATLPVLSAIDNLIAQKKIPVMIGVFINPGDISDAPGTPTYNFVKAYGDKWKRTLKDSMRSTLYDTVSDRYVRFLGDEILADVATKYNLRKDSYSRAITGLSSGGICAFNAAWQMPDQFSRVISWIGSFSAIQWKEDPAVPDGGQDYPDKILREPKRNLRVWLQDGSEDLDLRYGNWPLANLRMANALKAQEYDFHFSFGKGTHNASHGAAEFPAEMIWLWRDYDPAKTEQTYLPDPAEKSKPVFRVSITNRDAE
jgi:enterochelin esterase family protein